MTIKKLIKTYNDFPKKGIKFKDLSPIYYTNLQKLISIAECKLFQKYPGIEYSMKYVAGIESRGYILGAALAGINGLGFIQVRKSGKLPGKTIKEKYSLEYGSSEIEIHKMPFLKGSTVLLVDDIYATGGTMNAAMELFKKKRS